jgi:hypothetical protein
MWHWPSPALFFLLCGSWSIPANATEDNNRVVAAVGIQGQNMYITFTVAPSGACPYNTAYADLTSASANLKQPSSRSRTLPLNGNNQERTSPANPVRFRQHVML